MASFVAAHHDVILPFVYSYWHEATGCRSGSLAEKTVPDEDSAGGNWPQRTQVSLFCLWTAVETQAVITVASCRDTDSKAIVVDY